jgi:DNA polymerase
MAQRTPPTIEIPAHSSLGGLRSAMESAIPNAVFGEGPEQARIMLVGEQPGDEEDKLGRPFVGPAGRVLDAAIAESGLERKQLYLTNAVKTFLYVERGKRRIHKSPSSQDIAVNRPWLTAEISLVRPKVIVCLGTTAGQSVFGRAVRIGAERGRLQSHPIADGVVLTYHPSAVLRAQEEAAKDDIRRMLVADLALAKSASGI